MTTTAELKRAPLAVMKSALPRVAAAMRRLDNGELDAQHLNDVPRVAAELQDVIQRAQFVSGFAGMPHAARLAQEGRTAGGVAVISLRGFISPRGSLLAQILGAGPSGLEGFRKALAEAVGDSDIGSIVLDVDSPGGIVDMVPETAAAIREARDVKPITAVANTTAASAAYWLASQASEVVVTPSGEVGSIGVFATHTDWSKYDEDMGVKTTLVSAGKFKTEGNPYEPLSEEAEAYMQSVVDELYGMFASDVAQGREVAESQVRGGFGEGRMLLAKDAVQEGMADRVATLEEAIAAHVSGDPEGSRQATSAQERAMAEALAAAAEGSPVTFEFDGRKFDATLLAETPPAPEPDPVDDPPQPEPEPPDEEQVAARRQTLDMLYG